MPVSGSKSEKIRAIMHEFKSGTLHSGKKGPVVESPQQAQAIALRVAGVKRKKK